MADWKWREAEAAAYLRLKPATLRNWRWRGFGPPYIKAGGRVLYDPDQLREWAQKQTVDPLDEERGGSELLPASRGN